MARSLPGSGASAQAPSSSTATSQSNQPSEEIDPEVAKILFNLNLPDRVIVYPPTFWDFFTKDVNYIGRNGKGEEIYSGGRLITGTPPAASFSRGINPSTIFKNITNARSVASFAIGINLAKFEAAMAKVAGTTWQITKDGKAKILFHNGFKYVGRTFSSSTNGPTVEIWKDGINIIKYRLLN